MLGLDPFDTGIVAIVFLIVLVVLGVRVFVAAALTGFLGLLELRGWNVAAALSGTIPHSKTITYPLSVLPLFILIGFLAFYAGLTGRLFEAARRWAGWVPGGLAVATVFATAGFAAVSGASTATAAVFSRVAIPDMLKNGYDRKLAAGVVAAGGTLASLIPPSAILVIYAIIVEESVGKLLLGGFLPGAVSALIYAALIVGMCLWKPQLGRPIAGFTLREKLATVPGILPIVAVVLVIFGAIYTGKATPTEAAALGAMIVFAIYVFEAFRQKAVGEMGGRLKEALLETAKLTAMIFPVRALPGFCRPAGLLRRLGDDAGPAAHRHHDLHPAGLCRPGHVHGRHRHADPHPPRRVPGGRGVGIPSGLVRHHRGQNGGDLPYHAAHRAKLFCCRRGQPRSARCRGQVARSAAAGRVPRHRPLLRRRCGDRRRVACLSWNRALAAEPDGVRPGLCASLSGRSRDRHFRQVNQNGAKDG